jgi:uncharacterized protein (TIGR04255 family)
MKYQKNYVSNVICRVDFPEIPILKSEDPTQFHSAIKDYFPRIEQQVEAQLDAKDRLGLAIKEQHKKWTLSDREKNKKITLCFNYMALDTYRYTDYDEFKATWDKVYSVLVSTYNIGFFDRVGLRYINQINLEKGNPLVWADYINAKLISEIDFYPEMKSDIIRSMHQIVFNKEGIKTVFNYGIWNEHYPNALSQKQFVLDYDCFIDSPIEAADVSARIHNFIDIIYDLFEKSIDHNLRDAMSESK